MATHTITCAKCAATFTWQDPDDQDDFQPAADAGWTADGKGKVFCPKHARATNS